MPQRDKGGERITEQKKRLSVFRCQAIDRRNMDIEGVSDILNQGVFSEQPPKADIRRITLWLQTVP